MAKTKTVVSVVSKISDREVSRDAALVVIHGMDLGRKYDLVNEVTVVGRSSKADIQIDQESVSRSHARFISQKSSVTLSDLGSTNGTYVNDELVDGETKLRNGDFVKIGRTIFKFIGGGNIEQAYHEEIYRLTTVDGLTQVFNRRYFEEALDREISRGIRYSRELAFVLMDIDKFKLVNDEFGHLAGDSVLKGLASLIRNNIRREDVFARFGGEEFALLLPEVDIRGAVLMAEKIRKVIQNQKFTFEGDAIPITVSMGVATLGVQQRESSALIRAADARLYEAKQTGRNRVCA
jgi:two-component system, cell cycle response regulator